MPHPLTENVARLTKRLRRRGWLIGWSLGATVVLGVAVVLIGIDYATRWSDAGVRWLATGAWLAAIGWALDRFLLRPRGAAARPTLSQVATRIEQRFPALGSRLTSAIEFLVSSELDASAGSAELRRAVIQQTTTEVEQINLAETIDPSPLRRAAARFGWLAAGVVIVALLAPATVATGLTRLAAPWAGAEWPRQNRLAFVDPPTRIARGQAFEAILIDQNGPPPEDTQVEYRFESPAGRRIAESIDRRTPQSAGDKLLAVLERVEQPFAFRAIGGDDHTMPWIAVEVVDPPELRSLTITATPPSYSGLAAGEVGPDVHVLAGSQLNFTGEASETLAAFALQVKGIDGLSPDHSELLLPTESDQGSRFDLRLQNLQTLAPEQFNQREQTYRTSYQLQMTSPSGLVGVSKPRRLRVDLDTPPKIDWLEPTEALLVTRRALVPIRAMVSDNLAIASARLQVSIESQLTDVDAAPTEAIELWRGPIAPPRREGTLAELTLDEREVALDWDLAAWDQTPDVGGALDIRVIASDYMPQEGGTLQSRRINIISDEEFNQRVADAQAQLVRSLQQALESQRVARDKTRDAAANADDESLLDRLATLGFDQRRVGELITDPQRGVRRQAQRLLDELASNRIERPTLASQLERIAAAASRLADEPLPEASRAVADARRSAESGATQRLSESLAAADKQQTDVVDTLERLTDEMAEWSDLEQFARELAELAQKQRQLRDSTAADAAKSAAGARTPSEREADRRRLASEQTELGRRFDKLMRAMQRRLEAGQEQGQSRDKSLDPVADTLADAQDRATTGKLREATREIRQGRLGRAGDAQQQAADDLKELLETLRNRAATDPSKLAEQLRDTQRRLAEMQQQLDRLSSNPASDPRQQAAREQRLAEKGERLSRRMERLTADQAAENTKQGANQLADAAEQSEAESPSGAQRSREQAAEEFRQAQERLAERIEQLKNEATQRLLDQLAADVRAYLKRQQELLTETVELGDDAGALSEKQQRSKSLAHDQRGLREKVDTSAEQIAERKVFSLALGGAAGEMLRAAERLDTVDAGRMTQQHELEALKRLKHIADALESTPPEDEEEEQPPGNGGGQGGQGQPQQPPPFDVAELKMLRLMQLDLNARTRRFEAAAAEKLPPAESREAAEQLADEQRQLADLVQELLNRDNKDPRLATPQEVF